MQELWERRIDWDEAVPDDVWEIWWRWRSELPLLSDKHLLRCYFPKGVQKSVQLHGFCDASETAFAAVVYLRVEDIRDFVNTSLVMSKTRVAPLKRLTIPRLELCGAQLLAQILSHIVQVLDLPLCETYARTDSTVILSWLTGVPRRFKTYVGNIVSRIVDLIPPLRWRHVSGADNPADCASRGLFPSELLQHTLWWDGPDWLLLEPQKWPRGSNVRPCLIPEEEREVCLATTVEYGDAIPLSQFFSLTHLMRVTAWVLRFIRNCRVRCGSISTGASGPLSVTELAAAEAFWLLNAQSHCFGVEGEALRKNQELPSASCLRILHFIGASRGLSELAQFLQQQQTAGDISNFCSSQGIEWSFIPEHAPHFGGLWESAVRSMKMHLKRIVGNSKLSFEEFCTVLAQIESCLNSRPLVALPSGEDAIEALTPGHFLIGRPLESLPDPPSSYRSISLL